MIKNTVLPAGAGVVLGVREVVGWTVVVPALFAPRAAVGVLAGPEFVAGPFPHPPPLTRMTPVTRTRIHRNRRCDIFFSSYFLLLLSKLQLITSMIQRKLRAGPQLLS